MLKLGQIFRTYRNSLVILAVVLLGSGGFYVKKSGVLMPGPATSAHPRNEPLGGYVSHAEFEKECSHCHAPIHCVTDTRCQDCHMEIAQQRAEGTGLHSLMPGTSKCQTCHVEHRGREVSITKLAFANVNHEKLAGFSLDLHQDNYDGSPLDCETCHSQNSYVDETLDCITCHVEEDHDTMAAHIEEYGNRCIDCHDGDDRMIEFDHNAIYVLDGAHLLVGCEECHQQDVYVGAPTDCAGCHGEPELHANLFGQDCVRCHTAVAWAPAQLQQHTFLLDHGTGEQDIASCETCHAGTYTEYPCYSCHEYADMEAAHAGEQVPNLEDCVACHPTGRDVASSSNNPTGMLAQPGSGN